MYKDIFQLVFFMKQGRLSASAVGTIVGMQAQEIVQVAEHYAALSADAEVFST